MLLLLHSLSFAGYIARVPVNVSELEDLGEVLTADGVTEFATATIEGKSWRLGCTKAGACSLRGGNGKTVPVDSISAEPATHTVVFHTRLADACWSPSAEVYAIFKEAWRLIE